MSICKTTGEAVLKFLGVGGKTVARGVSRSKAFAEMAAKNINKGGFRSMSRATSAERLVYQEQYKNAFYLKRIMNNAEASKYLNKNFIVDKYTGRVFKKLPGGKRGNVVSVRDLHNQLVKKQGTKAVYGNKNAYLRNNIDRVRGSSLKPGSKETITVTRGKYRVRVKGADGKMHWETRKLSPGGTHNGVRVKPSTKKVTRPASNKYNGFKDWNKEAVGREPDPKFKQRYEAPKTKVTGEPKIPKDEKLEGEKVVHGNPMDEHPNTGAGDKKIPDKAQQEHWWRNKGSQFIHHAGSRAMTFAEKHPGWAIFTPFLAWQYLQAQLGGRDMLTQIQGSVLGWDTAEDGTILGAKGLAPTLNQVFSGTSNREDGMAGTTMKEFFGVNGYNQINRVADDAISFTENVGQRLGKAGDTISDTTHKIMDETGNLYDTAKDKAFTYPSDGATDGEGNQLIDSDGNAYSGTSVRPTGPGGITRQNVDFMTMAGGGILSLLARNPLARLAGGLAAGYGFEHNRVANKQMEMQQAQQQQQQSNQRVSFNQQPSPSESMRVSL